MDVDMRIRTPRDLGSAIRERRKALSLDQVQLAERVGASRRWLIQVENGKPGASLGLLLRTLNALDMPLILDVEAIAPRPRPEASDLDAILARARAPGPPA